MIQPWEMKEGKVTFVKHEDVIFRLKKPIDVVSNEETKKWLQELNEHVEFVLRYLTFEGSERKILIEEKVDKKKAELSPFILYHKLIDNDYDEFRRNDLLGLVGMINVSYHLGKLIKEGKVIKLKHGKYKLVKDNVKMEEDLKYKKELLK